MYYKYLIFSILYLIGAFVYYKFHKWWLSVRREKEEVLNQSFKSVGIIKDWVIIIMLLIASVISFAKFATQ
jgi:hypothetical protein